MSYSAIYSHARSLLGRRRRAGGEIAPHLAKHAGCDLLVVEALTTGLALGAALLVDEAGEEGVGAASAAGGGAAELVGGLGGIHGDVCWWGLVVVFVGDVYRWYGF